MLEVGEATGLLAETKQTLNASTFLANSTLAC